MKRTALTIPELAIIAGTRAALGAGVGMLIADRLRPEQRRGAGWALVAVGVLTTVPIAVQLFTGGRGAAAEPATPRDGGQGRGRLWGLRGGAGARA